MSPCTVEMLLCLLPSTDINKTLVQTQNTTEITIQTSNDDDASNLLKLNARYHIFYILLHLPVQCGSHMTYTLHNKRSSHDFHHQDASHPIISDSEQNGALKLDL